jgi:DNA polymerase-3 subunit delta'
VFDDFKDSQYIAYLLLVNSIRKNKISHAYLIDGNNNEFAFDFVMSFVKFIFCDKHYSNYECCEGCNKCGRIDSGNYTELKIIDSDSFVIKKEQLLDLKSEFCMKGIEGNKRIYVIKNCDKMNKQASNSLLKFLEEPEEGIIAILFTNHINNVLSTIISRCQVIKLVNNKKFNCDSSIVNLANSFCNNKNDIDVFLKDDLNLKKIKNVVDFLVYYEENGLDVMLYLKKMWYNIFQTRDDNFLGIFLMINFYYDVLKFKSNVKEYFFADYLSYIEKISNYNSIDRIMNKLNVCIKKYDELKFNLNVNLVIDDMIIGLGE